MQRDERGRFIRGNTIAKGNKGNTQPKYGNRNAVKHGLYEKIPYMKYRDDGSLLVTDGFTNFIIKEDGFHVEDGKIYFSDDVAEVLINAGFKLRS